MISSYTKFVTASLVFKKLNSYTVTALTMVLFEAFLNNIEDVLYDFILTLGTHGGRITWYFSWVAFNLFIVHLLDFFHTKLSIPKGFLFKSIRLCLLAFVFTYALDCLDRYVLIHDSTYFILLLLRSAIQIGIVCTFAYFLFKEKSLIIEMPHAAHNRSVDWFQSLQNLPPLQRARELEKWEVFTNNLPTDKTLNVSSRSDNYKL
jgi:hypothetical protein